MNRTLLGIALGIAGLSQVVQGADPYFGNGIKIGEVYQDRALIWARLTEAKDTDPSKFGNLAYGTEGWMTVRWREGGNAQGWRSMERVPVSRESDFTAQVQLSGLEPGTRYDVEVWAYESDSAAQATDCLEGSFRTAYSNESTNIVKGVVVSCQGLGTVDDPILGHKAYADILLQNADFFVHTGDVVYYDKDYKGLHPLSKNREQARQRWNRMFSLGWNRAFHSRIGAYFLKDDHDVLKDDCYPGQIYGELTFDDGVEIFREQTPQGLLPYRTVRWSKDVQLWLLEGREYRTPNRAPDGPDKSLLGGEQKAWLKRTIRESDATFKLVISPSPIVGPDKEGKKDNLSSSVYQTEGDELRAFLSAVDNLYVLCGDRHWQYASKDAETGLLEIGCGPINNEHAEIGGNPGMQPEHIYFGGGQGGYLVFEVTRVEEGPFITFRWYSISEPNRGGVVGPVNWEMRIPAAL